MVDRLRGVIWKTEDPRIRAAHRTLLPILLLTMLLTRLAVLLAGVVVPVADTRPVCSTSRLNQQRTDQLMSAELRGHVYRVAPVARSLVTSTTDTSSSIVNVMLSSSIVNVNSALNGSTEMTSSS